MATSESKTPLRRVIALSMSVLAGYVTVLSTGPVAANVRLTQIAPNDSAFWFSAMAASGSLVAAIGFLLFGRISNRLLETKGSRQLIFVVSAIALAPLSILLAIADSVPTMFAIWCLLQLPAAAILSTATAVVLELVPERFVGLASGLFGAGAVIAILYGVVIGTVTRNNSTLVLGIGVFTALILTIPAAITREKTLLSVSAPSPRGLTKAPKNFWFFIIASSVSLAVSALTNDYFFQLSLKILTKENTAAFAQLLFAISASAFLTASIVGGLVAKRTKISLSIFSFSLLISAVGVALIALIQTPETLIAGAILIGLGTGFNVSTQLPVMLFTLPNREELGRESGIYNLSSVIPGIVVPALGAVMITVSHQNWPILLGLTVAIAALLGAALARNIRIR